MPCSRPSTLHCTDSGASRENSEFRMPSPVCLRRISISTPARRDLAGPTFPSLFAIEDPGAPGFLILHGHCPGVRLPSYRGSATVRLRPWSTLRPVGQTSPVHMQERWNEWHDRTYRVIARQAIRVDRMVSQGQRRSPLRQRSRIASRPRSSTRANPGPGTPAPW